MLLIIMDDDDIEAVLATAKKHKKPHRCGSFNPPSSLLEPKAKIKQAIKDRIRMLADAYISLAEFIDDNDIRFVENNPKSKNSSNLSQDAREYGTDPKGNARVSNFGLIKFYSLRLIIF
mgnify:CR=1 FL=1